MVITRGASLGCIKRLGWVTIKTIKTQQPVSRCELSFCHVRRYPDNDRRFIRSAVWCPALIGIHPNNLHGAARNNSDTPTTITSLHSIIFLFCIANIAQIRSVDIELNALPYWAVVWLRWSVLACLQAVIVIARCCVRWPHDGHWSPSTHAHTQAGLWLEWD